MVDMMEEMAAIKEPLARGIKLHKEHMSSVQPPTDASQKKLMDYMEQAMNALKKHEMEMKQEMGSKKSMLREMHEGD